MNKTEKMEIIIIILLVLIFGGTLIYSKIINSKVEEEKIDETVSIVTDRNRFYTIDSAISKYIIALSSKNAPDVLKMLNNDYVLLNNLTEANVLTVLEAVPDNVSSSTREMYQVGEYDNIYKYYVKVRLMVEDYYSATFLKYTYLEITINENNITFAVTPINEVTYLNKVKEVETFKTIVFIIFVVLIIFFITKNVTVINEEMRLLPSEEELEEFINVNTKNEINNYENKDIGTDEMAVIYYTDFKNEVINYSDEMYSRIINKDDITEEVFNNYRSSLLENRYNNYLESYTRKYRDGREVYSIVNNYGETINVYINGVLDYDVELNI